MVLVHGGFWRKQYDRHLEDPVALDLASRGYLCWNIDYRSSAVPWPATLTDVAAGYDHLDEGRFADRVDRGRVAVVGHSAGGQLVAWLASRHRLQPDAPGYNHDVDRRPSSSRKPESSRSPVAAEAGLGGGAPQALVGGSPTQYPERYEQADPVGCCRPACGRCWSTTATTTSCRSARARPTSRPRRRPATTVHARRRRRRPLLPPRPDERGMREDARGPRHDDRAEPARCRSPEATATGQTVAATIAAGTVSRPTT